MTDPALAVGSDLWASVVVNCDPSVHAWEAHGTRRRWEKIIDAFRPVVERVTRDDLKARVQRALEAINHITIDYLRKEPRYREGMVQGLLDLAGFADNYQAFITGAAQARIPRRAKLVPTTEVIRLDAQHDPKSQELATWLNKSDELQEQLRGTDGSTVEFRVVTPKARQQRELFWFVYDPMFPAEVADSLLGKIESEAAYVLLRFATNWTIDDKIALSRERYSMLMRYARFRAGIPGANVPAVPVAERMDVLGINAKIRTGNDNFERAAESALDEIAKSKTK